MEKAIHLLVNRGNGNRIYERIKNIIAIDGQNEQKNRQQIYQE